MLNIYHILFYSHYNTNYNYHSFFTFNFTRVLFLTFISSSNFISASLMTSNSAVNSTESSFALLTSVTSVSKLSFTSFAFETLTVSFFISLFKFLNVSSASKQSVLNLCATERLSRQASHISDGRPSSFLS